MPHENPEDTPNASAISSSPHPQIVAALTAIVKSVGLNLFKAKISYISVSDFDRLLSDEAVRSQIIQIFSDSRKTDAKVAMTVALQTIHLAMSSEEGVEQEDPFGQYKFSSRTREYLKARGIIDIDGLRRDLTEKLREQPVGFSMALIEISKKLQERGEIDESFPIPSRADLLNMDISTLDLSVRSRKGVHRSWSRLEISGRTLRDLLKITSDDLSSGRNFGVASLREVKATLALLGLELGTEKRAPTRMEAMLQNQESVSPIDGGDENVEENSSDASV